MAHSRTIQISVVMLTLMALVAWGCSGADDGDQPAAAAVPASDLQIVSPSFSEVRPKVRIPLKNTCHGDNLSPPLEWSGTPDGTVSFALIAEDIDHNQKRDSLGRESSAPSNAWVHWVLYNIPAETTELVEGIPTTTLVLPDGTTQGTHDHKDQGYFGPCPPVSVVRYSYDFGEPAHRYAFRLYALDSS